MRGSTIQNEIQYEIRSVEDEYKTSIRALRCVMSTAPQTYREGGAKFGSGAGQWGRWGMWGRSGSLGGTCGTGRLEREATNSKLSSFYSSMI